MTYENLQFMDPLYQKIDKTLLLHAFHQRDRSAHKGNFGHVLVIGGDYSMGGAVRLCAEAALRVGAGLVSVATHPAHIAAINAERPEIMCHGVENPDELLPLIQKATVIAVGPGLGKSDWSRALFHAVIFASKPMVVDADALNLLSESPQKNSQWIITPHAGEAARLLQCTSVAIQENRYAAAKKLREKYDGIVVLK